MEIREKFPATTTKDSNVGDDSMKKLVKRRRISSAEEAAYNKSNGGKGNSTTGNLNNEIFEFDSSKFNKNKAMDDKSTKERRAGGGKTRKGKKRAPGKFKLAFTNRKTVRDLANSASNELSKEDLSCLTDEEKLQLSSWGLPASILNKYHSRGITSLFRWQLECLANEKVLEGRNLLYSAPTSAGKTLVSEILMIKRVLELGRKAIMILPFVSVAREKVYSLQSVFGDAGIRVEGFMGSVNPPGGFKSVDIAICTIEKANSLLNRLLEEDCLADLGTLIVDELHLIGDPHRGYLLELLLTKILYMTSIRNRSGQNSNSMNLSDDISWKPRPYHIQVIGMSATLPNLDTLARWLKAELYVTDFRPVPLKELLKVENKILNQRMEFERDVKDEALSIQINEDPDDVIYLSLETVLNGFSVLIFCPTKQIVEATATKLSERFFEIGNPSSSQYPEIGEKLRGQLNGQRIKDLLEQLKHSPGGVDSALSKAVMFGIGFHHAGLTYENRDIIESGFKRGVLKVIVATSTLSAGVNLPARRVIIVTPLFNGTTLDTMTYRQMCGRAGRNGIDTEGESILICPKNQKDHGMILFRGTMPLLKSALLGQDSGTLTSSMKRALLEAVASGIASLTSDVGQYAKCTFLFHSMETGLSESEELSSSQYNQEATVEECMKYLLQQDFIRIKTFEDDRPDEYIPTKLGSACLASSLSPDDAIMVYKELNKARSCFVLENELHVIYQVTPIYVSDQLRYISWSDYLKIFDCLDVSEKKVAQLIGVQENFIIRAMIGTVSRKNPVQKSDMAIHQRFYAALALNDLVNEKSLEYVAAKYNLNKGVLQNLQQASSTFAGMITAFCGRLGWRNLELLLGQFQERLEFGVQRELCELVKLECLNGQRARILYDAGVKSIMDLASADAAQIEHILHKATPFASDIHGGRESNVWMIGKDPLTKAQAAQKIVKDAREFVQMEHGQKGVIQFTFGDNEPQVVLSNRNRTHITFEEDKIAKEKCVAGEVERIVSMSEGKRPVPNQTHLASANVVSSALSHAELCFPRGAELEESILQREVEKAADMKSSGCMFEDSFPDMDFSGFQVSVRKCEEELSTLPTICELLGEDGSGECGKQLAEKIDVGNAATKPASYRSTGQGESEIRVNHSTPVIAKSYNLRMTLNQQEHTSPICATSSGKKERGSQFQRGLSSPVNANLTDDMLFLAALAEDSFGEDKIKNSDSTPEIRNPSGNATPQCAELKVASFRLSDSDTVAMKVMADEDTFFSQSEELFPSSDELPVTTKFLCNQHQLDNVINHSDLSIVRELNELEEMEEDFILTQVDPKTPDFNTLDHGTGVRSSSGGTETFSAWSQENGTPCSSSIPTEHEPVVLEGMVGTENITVKIVQCTDEIPDSYFTESDLVGIGIKLVHSQPRASASRHGIGARILGRKSSDNSLSNEVKRQHSLAIYNGSDIIWVLRWNNHKGEQRRRGKCNGRLESLISKMERGTSSFVMFDLKETLKSLLRRCGAHIFSKLPSGNRLWDPAIGQWMCDFQEEDWDNSRISNRLVVEYVHEDQRRVVKLGWDKEIVEAFLTWKVMTALKDKLHTAGLWNHFTRTEMPAVIPLMLMEMNGFGLDANELASLKQVLQFQAAWLELKAYQLAGRQFNISSAKDVNQILFREIGLKHPNRGKGTSKEVLQKLDHELAPVIMEWRKVQNALQKYVLPFQQERNLETGRVHGWYRYFTATGRVVMAAPSLQQIPRDFDLQNILVVNELEEIKNTCKIKFGTKVAGLLQHLDGEKDASFVEDIGLVSMRNAFVPCGSDFLILTVDYSQLELRILAHLSEESKLVQALNRGTDVFLEIASEWKKIPKNLVSNAMRQETKRIIYGIIYGMGMKALSTQLEIDEKEAAKFRNQFMKAYPGVRIFLDQAVSECEQKGYIETMTGRRRYLPLIHSRNSSLRAKAARQAVNSQIQGSAADLVKSAMARIHSALTLKYPDSGNPVEWNKTNVVRRSSVSLGNNKKLAYFPVLNLHDELIFEVRRTELETIAKVIKYEMESCMKLRVKLPVVLKVGDTWGALQTFSCD